MAKKIKLISLEEGKELSFKDAKRDIVRQKASSFKVIKQARKNYADCKEKGGDCKLTQGHLRQALDLHKMIVKKRKEKK